MKILIVEDDFTSRNLLAEMLREHGSIDIAVNGKEAVEAYHTALESEPYQLICLDIVIPGYHGDEILQIIRRTERLRHSNKKPAVVFITSADHTSETVKNAFTKGCDGYLIKPFDYQHLHKQLLQKGLISEKQEVEKKKIV